MSSLSCFKSYDVRGKLNEDFDEEICYQIGRAFALFFSAKKVIVGYDSRISSVQLSEALIRGILDQGSDVIGIGLSGTEEVYWATKKFETCGGIEVTASHNPKQWNALKLLNDKGEFISGDDGEDYFVHVYGLGPKLKQFGLRAGQKVIFDVDFDMKGDKAVNVRPG